VRPGLLQPPERCGDGERDKDMWSSSPPGVPGTGSREWAKRPDGIGENDVESMAVMIWAECLGFDDRRRWCEEAAVEEPVVARFAIASTRVARSEMGSGEVVEGRESSVCRGVQCRMDLFWTDVSRRGDDGCSRLLRSV
jgi:hypothetical protein